MRFIKGDWVTTDHGGDGIVKRVASDGSWVDVEWKDGWSKRMPPSSLKKVHTIERGDLVVTDLTEKRKQREEVIYEDILAKLHVIYTSLVVEDLDLAKKDLLECMDMLELKIGG